MGVHVGVLGVWVLEGGVVVRVGVPGGVCKAHTRTCTHTHTHARTHTHAHTHGVSSSTWPHNLPKKDLTTPGGR